MQKVKKIKILIIIAFSIVFLNTNYAQEKIIKKGDEWQYFDGKNSPAKNWFNNSDSTKNWETGITPLGYGDSVIKTEINFGDDPENKTITTYFKKTFIIVDPFKYILYNLNIQKDDGIVVYLNGREIIRIDMPDGEISHNSLASALIVSGKMEDYIHTKILAPEDFLSGVNTISASVHKGKITSEDCIFNIELIGDNNPNLLPLLLKETTLKNLKLSSKINDLNNKLSIEKKDLQLELTEKSKNNIKTSLYITGILLLVSILVMVYNWNYTKKKEKKLSKNIYKLKGLNNNKDRELMNTSLNYYNSQQYLKELKKELENSFSNDMTIVKKNIETIIYQLDFNIDYSDSWDNLKYHFNAIHSGFIDKITKSHPLLSETEIRHCVFMKLHLQTKEIARILNIDPRSVQASRYRIKKKMNLDENTDLKEYLHKINGEENIN